MAAAARVSVVCATYRRPAAVSRLLDALAKQDLPEPFEVVLSDDGSGPEVQAELRRLVAGSPLPVRLLEHQTNRGAAAGRNDGWRQATAAAVAFTDDDCQPAPGWLRAGLGVLDEGEVVVVGRVQPDPAQADNDGPWSRSLTVSSATFFQTANAFYRRSDLEAAGGFDESLARGGEDTDLGLRVCALGRRAVFAPDAVVLHDVRRGTAWALAKESATRWVDLPLVLRKHPELRESMVYARIFWKDSHPRVLLAIASLPLALWHLWLLVLAAPWLWFRTITKPRAPRRLRRITLLPGTFLIDAAEVLACVRGSLRHRTVLL